MTATAASELAATATTPAPVWDLINGFASYWAMRTGVELGLFDALDSGAAQPVEQLRETVGAQEPEPVRLLCETLTALGLLEAAEHGFRLSPVAARFLVSSSPMSMAALVSASPGPPQAWPELSATIRRGAPNPARATELAGFYPELVRATAATQAAVARAVAAELDHRRAWPEHPVIVDLGAGSGAWLTTLLAGRGAATGVAVDLPSVLPVAERAFAEAGMDDRVRTVAGDYLDVPLPVRRADVVVLAHVLRAEPAERARRLLHRAIELVGAAGVVVIADYPRPDRGASTAALAAARHELLLSLTMLGSTPGMGVSVEDIRTWAGEAGARLVHEFDALPRQHVYLVRPASSEESP